MSLLPASRRSFTDDGASPLAPARPRPVLLPATLIALAATLVLMAVLGPLCTGVIEYRYSETMRNQATGLDAVSLFLVAPIALLAALGTRKGRPAGALVALGPAAYALYMSVQYVIGPEYLTVPGNQERAFPLFALAFVLAGTAITAAWTAAEHTRVVLPAPRRRGITLLILGIFVFVGIYLANDFLTALEDFPSFVGERASTSEYDEHPTAYWIVAFLDLCIVVPVTLATGVGLLRDRPWATRAFYGVLGWYALVPTSVAAMAVVMLARDDPAADAGKTILFTVVALACTLLAAREFGRLFRGESPRLSPPLR